MVLPNSRRVPRVPRYLGIQPRKSDSFRLPDFHRLWFHFPADSAMNQIGNFPTDPKLHPVEPRDPEHATLSGLTHIRFGLFPVRSPLLGESQLFSLPAGTKMFQFPAFASATYEFSCRCIGTTRYGFPHSEISGSKLV
jgi:hypothetical protein